MDILCLKLKKRIFENQQQYFNWFLFLLFEKWIGILLSIFVNVNFASNLITSHYKNAAKCNTLI